MNVFFSPEVEDELLDLINLLVEKEYIGTYPFAIKYVEDLITYIQQNISIAPKKKAPAYFSRFGSHMEYISYKRNQQTTWYIFFTVVGNLYNVQYITNNHRSAQYL